MDKAVVLEELSKKSDFKNETSPIRALESALFMIGYSIREMQPEENFA
ncbi:MAG: hypothetical protein ABFR62_10790 [Bacteroidota bacterium]